ncbi:hypothetical protein TGAMA5MH_09524 [Trichoderma gamsii]|uniref:Uncharacterized protein n=1 Tax=Trichoderma gamsii TaxID=398673 RepID=A0A2K0SYT7_9HYPO|nr:hypothetical protein TGAMA5MH_09524 [Trichoderma gamsii]
MFALIFKTPPINKTPPEAKSTPSYTCITFNVIAAGEETHLLLAACKRAEYRTSHLYHNAALA